MTLKKLALPALLLSTFTFSGTAAAHAIWVAKVHGEQAVSYGHAGTDTDAYSADKIKKAYGYKADGSKSDLAVSKADNHVALDTDGYGLVAVVLDNGYWAQDKDGNWVNKRGDQVDGATKSSQYFKETTAYLNPRVKPQATGLALEMVPEVNPASLKKGDDLKVQVLFEGKPVEGAEVSSNYFDHDAASGKTDSNGYVTLAVPEASFNIFEVSKKVESDDPFDHKGYTTTLSFVAKHEHNH